MLLQASPRLAGEEVRLRAGVLFSVIGLDDNHPPSRVIFLVFVAVVRDIPHAVTDPEGAARLPGERFAFGRGGEGFDADQLVAGLRFHDDTHRETPHGKLSSPWSTSPSWSMLVWLPSGCCTSQ